MVARISPNIICSRTLSPVYFDLLRYCPNILILARFLRIYYLPLNHDFNLHFVDEVRTYRYVVSNALKIFFFCQEIFTHPVSRPTPISKFLLMEYLNYVLTTQSSRSCVLQKGRLNRAVSVNEAYNLLSSGLSRYEYRSLKLFTSFDTLRCAVMKYYIRGIKFGFI
jgi:hypothetical protein